MASLTLFFPIAFIALLSSATTVYSTATTNGIGFRLRMSHVHAAENFTTLQLLKRSKERRLTQFDGRLIGGDYLADVAIGTPPQTFKAVLSTGTDLIWTQCKPCKNCLSQHDPLFDPRKSSSFSSLSCSHELCKAYTSAKCGKGSPECEFSYEYFGVMVAEGVLGKETLTLGTGDNVIRVPNLVFGCGSASERGSLAPNSSGQIGLDRGPLSLVSQLKVGRFSHCFASYRDIGSGSPLFFGTQAKLDNGEVHTTPLLRSSVNPTFYYLPLKGITVGKSMLSIPASTFELKRDGSGGTIVDSMYVSLFLHEAAFEQVMKAFRTQMKLPAIDGTGFHGYEICFKSPHFPGVDVVPRLVLHFDGADLDMQIENYLAQGDGLLCVVIKRSRNGMSIVGNFATQNMHVLYDLEKEMVSFQPAKCSEL